MFCFTMSYSIQVEILIEGFKRKTFTIFNLEKYNSPEDTIELEDLQGRRTAIYTKISRKNTGQKVVFYCKKALIDSLESEIEFFYRAPASLARRASRAEIVQLMIPCIEQPDIMQKIYVIPEQFSEIHAALQGGRSQDSYKVDIETPTTQVEFKLQDDEHCFNFCHCTDMYLVASDDYIYSKITTVNPYYIFVNQSNYTILVEQAEMQQPSEQLDYQLPMILEPNQRQPFFFRKINKMQPDIDEFLHIKLLDEEVTGKDLEELVQEQEQKQDQKPQKARPLAPMLGQGLNYGLPQKKHMLFIKQYSWSSPFMICEVDQFTLQVRPNVRKQRLKEQMNGLNVQERMLLTKIMSQSQFLRVKCKADLKQAYGSMFVVIEEEDAATCEYKIMNSSKHLECTVAQHIVSSPLSSPSLHIKDQIAQRCKPGEVTRFTWDSVLHQKILRLSFAFKGRQMEESENLELCELSQDQEYRVLPSPNQKFTAILMPFH